MNDSKLRNSKANILIVDDTRESLRLLSKILIKQGYAVRPVTDGNLALSSAQAAPPDLILLDIMMTGLSGYDVCKNLKANERTRDIPVIFISAKNEIFDKVRAFSLGGIDYITKPFQPEEVLVRINAHLMIRKLQKQLQEQNVRLQKLSEATFEGIIIHDDGHILDVNQTFEKMFGYHRSELIGKHTLEFITPEFREIASDHLRTYYGHPYEAKGLKKDGSVFPIEIQVKTMPYKGHNVRVTAVRDISRQKAMEEEKHHLQHENIVLKSTIKDRYRFGNIIGKSPTMQEMYELIVNAAASEHNVIIYGESGTGKELVARTIHSMSDRHNRAFVAVNCGAISESLFEREFFGHRKSAFTGADLDKPGFFDAAHNGTLFFDEVGELSLAMQVKLLRAIETGEYTPVGDNKSKKADVRIIAATNKNLEDLLRKRLIREDFFYRIHVIEISVPPLRERKEDIPLLIEHLLDQYRTGKEPQRLPAKITEALYHYDWPGNVRELQNKLKRYFSMKRLDIPWTRQIEPIEEANLVSIDKRVVAWEGYRLHKAVETLEKRMIAEVLEQNHWHRGKTAEVLGVPRKTLQRKMEKYGFQ